MTIQGQQPIGGTLRWYRELDSTQEELNRVVRQEENPEHGLTIAAATQSAGRGMGENTWEGEPGKNLAISFYIRPTFLTAEQQFFVNIFTSLAVYELVKAMFNHPPVQIKWPNDIYAGNGKIAGILIQHSIRGNGILHSLVGIGLNVNQIKFTTSNAVSIFGITGVQRKLQPILDRLIELLNRNYAFLQTGKLEQCRTAYKRAMLGMDRWLLFRYRGNTITARITGISSIGFLQLETEGNVRIECDLKEIEFLL